MKDFIVDFESLGCPPDCAVVSMAALVFVNNPYNPPTFKELVDTAFIVRGNYRTQGRKMDRSTIDWWKKQSAEARKGLVLDGTEVSVAEMLNQFFQYLKENGFNKKDGYGYCRGMSFDFPILVDMIRETKRDRDTFYEEPCFFWNQRDTRTVIESTLMKRGQATCPLPAGTLDGFVKHNPVHDIARDILMMLYAQRYALGLDVCPAENKADIHSL